MAEHLSQSELDYPFKLLEYFNGFRISKVCVLWETQNTEFLNISIKEFYQNECMNINQSIDINQYFCNVESPEASLADRLNNVFTTCDIYCCIMGICFMWEHLLFMACPPLSFFFTSVATMADFASSRTGL